MLLAHKYAERCMISYRMLNVPARTRVARCPFVSPTSQTLQPAQENLQTARDGDNLEMASLALNKFLIVYGANTTCSLPFATFFCAYLIIK